VGGEVGEMDDLELVLVAELQRGGRDSRVECGGGGTWGMSSVLIVDGR